VPKVVLTEPRDVLMKPDATFGATQGQRNAKFGCRAAPEDVRQPDRHPSPTASQGF
jgi:hypothetical protein